MPGAKHEEEFTAEVFLEICNNAGDGNATLPASHTLYEVLAKVVAKVGDRKTDRLKSVLAEAVIKALNSHRAMSEQMLQNPKVFEDVSAALLPEIYERARAQSRANGAGACHLK